MARPKLNEKPQLKLEIDRPLHEALEDLAWMRRMSKAALVRQVLADFAEREIRKARKEK